MKKFVSAVMLLSLLVSIFPAIAAGAAVTPKLYLNGKQLQTSGQPRIVGQSTLVPVRTVTEGLGFTVDWKSPEVYITNGETSMLLTIKSKTAVVNDKKVNLEAPAAIIENLTYVPLRFVSEQFGLNVDWDQSSKSVYLNQQALSPPASGGDSTGSAGSGTGSSTGTGSGTQTGSSPGTGSGTGTQTGANPGNPDGSGTTDSGSSDSSVDLSTLKTIQYDGLSSIYVSYDGPAPQVKTEVLTNPDRIVVDLPQMNFAPDFSPGFAEAGTNQGSMLIDTHPLLKQVRYSLYSDKPSTVRIVLDLAAAAHFNVVNDSQGVLRIDVLDAAAPVPAQQPGTDTSNGVYKIVIDAGHGGKDPGAPAVNGRNEKEYNLAVALKVKALLDQDPRLKGYLTRSDDTFVELNDRAQIANDLKADVFISIHANRADSASVSGSETYYSRPESLPLANIIHKHLVKGTGLPDRKVRQANFLVIRKTTMPAILLECGYLSNSGDTSVLFDDAKENRIAAEIVAGIKEYLKLN
jgi:N-acetylmuramoyl-L-alanine amidase